MKIGIVESGSAELAIVGTRANSVGVVETGDITIARDDDQLAIDRRGDELYLPIPPDKSGVALGAPEDIIVYVLGGNGVAIGGAGTAILVRIVV